MGFKLEHLATLFVGSLLLLLLLGNWCNTRGIGVQAAFTFTGQEQEQLERYFRSLNITPAMDVMAKDTTQFDVYHYAFLNWTFVDADGELMHSEYKEEVARYGEGRIKNVTGKLIHVSDYDDLYDDYACKPNLLGTLGTPFPPHEVAWIALVQRGRCTFEEKVRNCYNKGAAGVIIFNDKKVSALEKMQIKGKSRNITAVITYLKVGMELADLLVKGHDVTLSIVSGQSGMRPLKKVPSTTTIFIATTFIILMLISLTWLVAYYIKKYRCLQVKEAHSRDLSSMTKKVITKIPTKTGKQCDEKDLEADCCAICIESYKPSDIIRILPCNHEFHRNCIDPWLIEHRTCPMCKLDVLKYYGYVFIGSEESIIELEADRPTVPIAMADLLTPAASSVNATIGNPTRGGALVDLIRSRDFIMDFPRVFVLEAGRSGEIRFPTRMPERSLSTLSMWQSQTVNERQQSNAKPTSESESAPQRRSTRKDAEVQQAQLLSVHGDVRQRRARSAEGRYASGCFGARQHRTVESIAMESDDVYERRRDSLADATYAQSMGAGAVGGFYQRTWLAASAKRPVTRKESVEIQITDDD